MRTAQVLKLTNDKWMTAEWVDIQYENITEGQIFRLFEEDGTPVVDGRYTVWVATSDAFLDEHGWGIMSIPQPNSPIDE